MSIAAVSISTIFQELQSFYQNRQADLKQLGIALQNGDLNGVQQAFQNLAVLGENGPFANSEPFSKSSRVQAFNTIGEALQAGDLARAQAAFATLTGNPSHSQATPAAVVNFTSTQQPDIEPFTQNVSIYQQLQAYRQQRQADVAQLGEDLQAGNLSAAQQDVAALTALGQSGPNKNGQVFQRVDRSQDFQAIAQALQSGDLAGAQSAFASLQSTYGQTRVPEPPIYKTPVFTGPPITQPPVMKPPLFTGPPVTKPPLFTGPPTTQPPVTEPPITKPPVLFMGPPVKQPPVTEPPVTLRQFTINFYQQQNYELVVNLSFSSTSEAQASAGPSLSLNA